MIVTSKFSDLAIQTRPWNWITITFLYCEEHPAEI